MGYVEEFEALGFEEKKMAGTRRHVMRLPLTGQDPQDPWSDPSAPNEPGEPGP